MRNPLNKRVFREIKENAGKYLGIFLILVCVIMVGSAFMVTLSSANYALKQQVDEDMTEDGNFDLSDAIPEELRVYFDEQDVLLEDNFYVTENDFQSEAKVLVYEERKKLNLYQIFEGAAPQTEDEVLLDRLFADNHDIKVGDWIRLCGRTLRVSGLAAFADYTSLFKSNQDLVMDVKGFGVAMVSEKGFAQFDKGQVMYHYSYRFEDRNLDDGQKKEKVEQLQAALLKHGCNLTGFLTADRNQCISFLKNDIGSDGPMMEAFVYILLAIVAFVFAVLTANTIEKEAAVIGTLRALGYTRLEMIGHYLRPTMLVTLVAAVLGNVLGYTLMMEPFMSMYYSSYCIPPVPIRFSPRALAVTTIAPIIIMVVINVGLLWNKLTLTPLKFLRKDLKKGKQAKALKLPDWSFLKRFRIRVILQNKVCYLILFVGIYLSGLLLMFGVGLGPLLDHYVDNIDETLPYEYQYILKAPVQNSDGEKLKMYTVSTYSERYQKDVEVSLMGIEEDSDFFTWDASTKKDEAVITRPMAKKLKLQVGDQITLKDTYYDREFTFLVTEIVDYDATLGIFMKRDVLNSLLEAPEDDFNCLLSNEKLDVPEEYVAKYLTRSDILGATAQLMDMFDTVLKVFNISSVVIYMILMYILTKTVIEKNALYISFMKVFGYDNREVGKLYLRATAITVIASVLINLPLQHMSFVAMMDYVTGMIEGYVPFYLPPWVYLFIAVVGIGAYYVINFFHVRKVRRIPMNDALKNRE
ncbi:MAG: ABC transporter permease [Wujia sp.]